MTNHAANGAARERRVRDRMAEAGWTPIMRAAASKGAGDLLLGHPVHGGALIQVGTAAKTLGPADRDRFVTAADLTCCLPILAVATRAGIRYWHVGRGVPSTWKEWTP
jgi:hypothetical protein